VKKSDVKVQKTPFILEKVAAYIQVKREGKLKVSVIYKGGGGGGYS